MVTAPTNNLAVKGFHLNYPPADLQPQRDLPEGFLEFLEPLHRRFTPWQQALIQDRARALEDSHQGNKPAHRYPAEAVRNGWRIELPDFKRIRVGQDRFRGLRCVHTHLHGEDLTRDDLTDLALLRLDLMAALDVSETSGGAGIVKYWVS